MSKTGNLCDVSYLRLDVTPTFYGVGSTNAPDPASLTEGFPINVPQTAGSIAGSLADDLSASFPNLYSAIPHNSLSSMLPSNMSLVSSSFYSPASSTTLKNVIQKHVVSLTSRESEEQR